MIHVLMITQIQEIRDNLERLLGKVKVTDGTNTLPAMDAPVRAGWQHTQEMPLAHRIEWNGAGTVCYVGWAAPGAATSAAAWRVKRVTLAGDDLSVEWADGDALYNNVWDNRSSLSYS